MPKPAAPPLWKLWRDADHWLRHWQRVGGLGLPEQWEPLAFDAANYAAMLERVDVALGSMWGGTEQGVAMKALAAQIRGA